MKTTDLTTAKEFAHRARHQVLEAAAQVAELEGRDADPLHILSALNQVPEHRLSSLVNELIAA